MRLATGRSPIATTKRTWLCTLWLVVLPVGVLYLLFDIERFAAYATAGLAQPIRWYSVTDGQWYGLWALTTVYLGIGYAGVVYLRKAFSSFANGHWFDVRNSRNLRRFAILLMIQGVAKPVHFAVSSVVLSLHHPPGDKVLSISLGSNELILAGAGLVMWVLADLLIEGTKAAAENRQFV